MLDASLFQIVAYRHMFSLTEHLEWLEVYMMLIE